MELVVSLVSGYSSRTMCAFVEGEKVRAFSIGSEGADWLVRAQGVEAVHVLLAFDGRELFASSGRRGAVVHVAGVPVDREWHQVPDGAEIRFGDACLGVSSRAVPAGLNEAAPTRLPQYFMEVRTGSGRASASVPPPVAAKAPKRASLGGVVVVATAACVVLIVAAMAIHVRRSAAAKKAAAPPVVSALAASTSSAPPSATTSATPAAGDAARGTAALGTTRELSTPAPGPLIAPAAPELEQKPGALLPVEPPRKLVSFPQNVANRPIPRVGSEPWLISDEWRQKHERLLSTPNRAAAEVVFLGDSITEAWHFAPAYKERFQRYAPLNLGISGDLTQHLLWRLEHGEVDGIHPKVAVLMIGVNNLAGGFSSEDTMGGVRAVVGAVRARLPDTFILLLGVLPARQDPENPLRAKIAATNQLLAGLAAPGHVAFYDLGAPLLEPDGTITKEVMRDFLHPTALGYERLS
ncbi:MAG TPA: GDSL-type esterase/lipase family protein, partial [Polyangiaceae bacterium]|nr:GDSL-type esterase/lipase family protein [Polyangiaceae bacterium]